jgi:hypothetical protein
MTLKEIAFEINKRSTGYEIGNLQSIRKDIKGLKRKSGSSIFVDNPNTLTEYWAYHYGGRSEIQYNIGFEDEGLRYGLAFSLETSQTLPNIDLLYPKILKLNCLIREQSEFFEEFKMWNWIGDKRSEISEVIEVQQSSIKKGIFIFFGKILPLDKIDIDEILQTFDNLLGVYKTIETSILEPIKPITTKPATEFAFNNKARTLPKTASYTTVEREINVDIRHSYLQELLQEELIKQFGKENVSIENLFNGNKIDIVVKHDNDFSFYEVKTASSAKSCVRQAIGQLFEYAFGNGKMNASSIYVAGEFPIDNETDIYLKYLREEFKIPIYYKLVKK